MRKEKFLLSLTLLILGINLLRIYPQIRREISIIRRNLWANYDWKMGEKLGNNFYSYAKFLQKEIPEDATVMIPPPRFPWPQTGNKYYLNYFLYPRKLVNWDESKLRKVDYVLALWGESEPIHEYPSGFPKKDMEGRFVFYDNDDPSRILNKEGFKFKTDMKDGVWGLVELN